MTVKELKEKLADVPDDIEVTLLAESGYLIDANDAYVDEHNSETFVVSV